MSLKRRWVRHATPTPACRSWADRAQRRAKMPGGRKELVIRTVIEISSAGKGICGGDDLIIVLCGGGGFVREMDSFDHWPFRDGLVESQKGDGLR